MTWVKRYWANFCQKIKELWHELWRWVGSWSLFHTVIVMILICLAALAGAWYLWSWWAHIRSSQTNTTVNLDTVSLATVGGLGGLVALIVSYRKQAMNERNEADGKLTDAVHLLGENEPSTRIAGVYALTNVGERYPDRQQQIIDILCGYLRTKREDDGPTESTIIATLKSKLNKNSWTKDRDINLDLHGATITESLDLRNTKIHSPSFDNATFNTARFDNTRFSGVVTFDNSALLDNTATFNDTVFNAARFNGATFDNAALFINTVFNGTTTFDDATFSNSALFNAVTFNNSAIFMNAATFNGTTFDHGVGFISNIFDNGATFDNAVFDGVAVFNCTAFKDKTTFDGATFDDKSIVEKIRKNATFNQLPSFKNIRYKNDAEGNK